MRAKRNQRDFLATTLLPQAYATDPHDRIICAVGRDAYSTIFGLIPTALAVLRIAAEIEPVPCLLLDWYQNDPIDELGGYTAEQLVSMGRGEAVIGFLRRLPRTYR
ncbi:hypothetical protein [Dyella silvae]|uniref:hypothetical protein n=1 Tax=Dyella silvae TaxID=2994424 RepID=UPI00226566E9|nr:hypothetical protein [Dyella silvae]